jgi:hypothetical protein
LEHTHRLTVGRERWLERVGEVELIGGWAEVVLGEDFAALGSPDYQVFVTAYDPVQVFVQNRSARSFEIHALPGVKGTRTLSMRCGYRVVARCACEAKAGRNQGGA